MCLAFSSKGYLVAAALLFCAAHAHAEGGVVQATGAGRDAPEAIVNLLRTTIGKHFRTEPNPQLTRVILQNEILPNASSYVQSYRITDTGKSGTVSLAANLDLDVIRGLLSLTPKNLGEAEGAKALVLVRGPKLPDAIMAGTKATVKVVDPFKNLGDGARERFLRRDFQEAELTPAQIQDAGVGEDYSSAETLRGLGDKAGARVALGVTAHYETFDNENSHNKEERLVLTGLMVDTKSGATLARASVNVVNPKTRREQYALDLQRNVIEESKDLFQDVFVAAGRRVVKVETHSDFSVVRVLFASNAALVNRFKQLLEGVSGVRSVVDFSVRRGKYDFAVRPAIADSALAKAVAAIQATDLTVIVIDTAAGDADAHPPSVQVRLMPKEPAVPGAEGGANAIPNPTNVPGPRR
jgi:hypothetical protein